MHNETYINDIRKTVEKAKEDTGFNEIQKRQNELREERDHYESKRNELKSLLFELINQRVEKSKGRATINEKYTIRDGKVYTYGSTSTTSLRSLRNNSEIIAETAGDEVVSYLERIPESYSQIDIESKTLITEDEYEYDAVTIKIAGYSSGIKLVDTLGGSGSCGGDKIDFEKQCLDEITTIMKYLPFIDEVVSDAEYKVEERFSQMEKLEQELREVVS